MIVFARHVDDAFSLFRIEIEPTFDEQYPSFYSEFALTFGKTLAE